MKQKMIKCHLGVTPRKECYEVCVTARRCEALKMWEKEEELGKNSTKVDSEDVDLINRPSALEAIEMLLEQTENDKYDKTWNFAIRSSMNAVKHHVQSVPPDGRLLKIADLVEGTIDHFDLNDAIDLIYQIKDVLHGLPERQKGEWIIYRDCEGKSRYVTCNICGYKEFNWYNPNFCPHCGAEMRGEQDE